MRLGEESIVSPQFTRRDFMGKMTAGTAIALAANYALSAPALDSNDTVHFGAIGIGGRAQQLLKSLAEVPGLKIVALCDVYDERFQQAKALAIPDAFTTKDYREILARQDIDAVVVGTPDHWHVPVTIDAVKAGKDVYVEKPLTHDLREGEAVIKAVKDSKRIVQVGMQQRSMPHLQEAFQIVRSGDLGKIHKVHLTWNRNLAEPLRKREVDPKLVDWDRFLGSAPRQPLDATRMFNWRWFWDFGGGVLTDLMVHWIDVVHWFLDLDHPTTAVTIGDSYRWKDIGETPDTIQTILHYPEHELQVYFEGTFSNARNGAMMEFMGEKATLYADRGRYEFHPEKSNKTTSPPGQPATNEGYREFVLGSGPRGADFYDKPRAEVLHLTNWVECIRSRKAPASPVEAGVSAASAAHLGNLAFKNGGRADWGA